MNLTYLTGEALLGDDDEATVDGSHPSDLGLARISAALAPAITAVFNKPQPSRTKGGWIEA